MSKQAPKLYTVTLQRDHTHAGADLKAGATIEVDAADRAWLIAHGVVVAEPSTDGGAE